MLLQASEGFQVMLQAFSVSPSLILLHNINDHVKIGSWFDLDV